MTSSIKIITAIHGRIPVTKAFCMASERIRNNFGIETFAVVTPDNKENIALCNEYKVNYITHRNLPLGRKWNMLVNYMKGIDFTHLLVLGSDDIASDSFIRNLPTEHDVSGVHDLWFWGLNPKRTGFDTFGYWRGTRGRVGGVGRLISRGIIEALDFTPWPDDINCRMDGNMKKKIDALDMDVDWHSYSLKDHQSLLLDIKYEQNISSLSPTLPNTRQERPEDVLYKHIPKEEVDYLMSLRKELV